MSRALEYHISVRSWFSPAVPLLSLFGLFLFSASDMQAQINAPPSSVTSPGFGGRPVNGPPASVTSLGPRGYAPNASIPYRPNWNHNGTAHHRRRDGDHNGAYLYAYPVPYAYDSGDYTDAPDPSNDDSNYQGGPTVFDRRGSGARSYVPPVDDPPPAHATNQNASEPDDISPEPEPAAAPTLLVFRDGRKLEVSNYAIVGTTLFDLTPGHPRRIAVADLDLDATRKDNDEHGVIFQLPPSLQAN